MSVYPYYVAALVPDASRDAANDLFAETTGRDADRDTFRAPVTDTDGGVWWLASFPCRPENLAKMEEHEEDLGGIFEIIREVVDGEIVRLSTVSEFLERHGMEREQHDDIF